LSLTHDEWLSNFNFNFNLRHYMMSAFSNSANKKKELKELLRKDSAWVPDESGATAGGVLGPSTRLTL
jgi:hypothetical protein